MHIRPPSARVSSALTTCSSHKRVSATEIDHIYAFAFSLCEAAEAVRHKLCGCSTHNAARVDLPGPYHLYASPIAPHLHASPCLARKAKPMSSILSARTIHCCAFKLSAVSKCMRAIVSAMLRRHRINTSLPFAYPC